jgi:hypothetical protein
LQTQRSRRAKKSSRERSAPRDQERLAREVAKLDPKEEQAMANEGLSRDLEEWPED